MARRKHEEDEEYTYYVVVVVVVVVVDGDDDVDDLEKHDKDNGDASIFVSFAQVSFVHLRSYQAGLMINPGFVMTFSSKYLLTKMLKSGEVWCGARHFLLSILTS